MRVNTCPGGLTVLTSTPPFSKAPLGHNFEMTSNLFMRSPREASVQWGAALSRLSVERRGALPAAAVDLARLVYSFRQRLLLSRKCWRGRRPPSSRGGDGNATARGTGPHADDPGENAGVSATICAFQRAACESCARHNDRRAYDRPQKG